MSASRKLAGWGDPRHGPHRRFAVFDEGGHGAYQVEHRRWLDHLYRLTWPDGTVEFVSEPYELGEQGLLDLADLAAEGWRVAIRADRAQHYRGHTLWIGFKRSTGA